MAGTGLRGRSAGKRKSSARTKTGGAKQRAAAKPKKSTKKSARAAQARQSAKARRGATKRPAKKPLRKDPDLEVDADVLEFIKALDRYKKEHNRPFPGWSEVLAVLKSLGYRKVDS